MQFCTQTVSAVKLLEKSIPFQKEIAKVNIDKMQIRLNFVASCLKNIYSIVIENKGEVFLFCLSYMILLHVLTVLRGPSNPIHPSHLLPSLRHSSKTAFSSCGCTLDIIEEKQCV